MAILWGFSQTIICFNTRNWKGIETRRTDRDMMKFRRKKTAYAWRLTVFLHDFLKQPPKVVGMNYKCIPTSFQYESCLTGWLLSERNADSNGNENNKIH